MFQETATHFKSISRGFKRQQEFQEYQEHVSRVLETQNSFWRGRTNFKIISSVSTVSSVSRAATCFKSISRDSKRQQEFQERHQEYVSRVIRHTRLKLCVPDLAGLILLVGCQSLYPPMDYDFVSLVQWTPGQARPQPIPHNSQHQTPLLQNPNHVSNLPWKIVSHTPMHVWNGLSLATPQKTTLK